MRLRSGQLLVDAQPGCVCPGRVWVAVLCAPGLHQLQGLRLCSAGQLQLDRESVVMLVAFSEGPQRKCVLGAGGSKSACYSSEGDPVPTSGLCSTHTYMVDTYINKN